MSFLGLYEVGDTLRGIMRTLDSSGTPSVPDSTPTFRIYGPDNTVMPNGTGSASLLDTATPTDITFVSNTVTVTSASHGLQVGMRVTISGSGMTNVNGTYQIATVPTSSTFTYTASSPSGTYGGAGTWSVTGLYGYSKSLAEADGYEAESVYRVVGYAVVSSVVVSGEDTFQVV